MRKLLFALVLGVSACASVPTSNIADAEKALAVAHLAYQAVGLSLKDAAQSGVLKGSDAATAKALFDQAGAALDAADQADALANAEGVAAQVASAQALVTQLETLLHR